LQKKSIVKDFHRRRLFLSEILSGNNKKFNHGKNKKFPHGNNKKFSHGRPLWLKLFDEMIMLSVLY
jgi:hypothetical protein